MPTTCNYYVTLRCNQRCTFCNIPHTNDGSPSREPTMEQVRANLRDLKRLGVFVLDVTGGEPLLYRNLVEMLTLAKKMRFMTTRHDQRDALPEVRRAAAWARSTRCSSPSTRPTPDEHDRIRAMKSFHLCARGARRRAQAPPAALHLARRDERVVRQGRRDDPLREGPGRDPLPQPVLLVLRQRGARSGEGQGALQVLRQARRHRRPRAARAHLVAAATRRRTRSAAR